MTLLIIFAIIVFAICLYGNRKNESYEQIQKRLAEEKYANDQKVDNLLVDLKNETRRIEAVIQAEIVGDTLTMDSLKRNDYHGPLPERRADGGWLSIFDNLRILSIAGINHRKNIDRYIGRVECALVPEPTNEFDPDAIKIVAEDSHHLGYIPSEQTDFVRSLTANEFPYRCTAFIEAHEDENDGHKFFVGYVYIKRLD